MRITLATSPHVRHPAVLANDFRVEQDVMYGFAPVGLLSLIGAARRECANEPRLFDLNRNISRGVIRLGGGFYESAAEALLEDAPDVLGFMTECDSYHHILQICAAVKARRPDCHVILGGPHASAVARPTLERRSCVDAIVVGEGELSFPKLIAALAAGHEGPVTGVLRRLTDGSVLDGGPAALIDELDDLPVPAYDVYHPDPGEEIFLEVGRGCPFSCRFCSTAPFWKRRHRVKSPDRILFEIRHLAGLFATRRVHFTHDLFTTDRSWVEAVCRTLIDARAPVRWTCSARTDTVDPRLLILMSAAGCDAIYFGIESGSERILEEIHKKIPLERSMSVLQACREVGITPNAGFIAGFPGEDENSLEDTFAAFQRALEIGARPVHIFGFCPFADSSLYAELDGMECGGHFLDLPLGPALDRTNRDLVAGDPGLFGSYFRPRIPGLDGRAAWIQAIDEFSPLVESAVWPALLLSRAYGGLFAVFRSWVEWIGQRNADRGAAGHRRFYGGPADFCDFLLEALEATPAAPPHARSLALVARTNLRLRSIPSATTMANHRSTAPPPHFEEIGPASRLSLGNVLAHLRVEEDLGDWLTAAPGAEPPPPPPGPCHLVWQRKENGDLRLLQVDEAVFHMLADVREAPRAAADLLRLPPQGRPEALWGLPEVQRNLTRLTQAVEAGLLSLEEA